ncbi:hypothetical protein ZIOFF_045737 [Zingiber officinale]|uniref:non-specific serine/threonine protein kinase n=1 Tax=Zingiber officinale TaxID=94328 RepID=A0A8J5L1K3_ZINOF|nr:hypothetical protein ZIOFF_045737 [Zingiber officinale]
MELYQKLDEGSNMSIDSVRSLQTSIDGGSAAMSLENSSVGSNNSRTGILHHTGLRLFPGVNFSVGHSVLRPGRVSHAMNEDALAQTLMDPRYPTESLENYDEWTLYLRKLNMGVAFAQGAFGKLYKGTYDGQDVAIKLLEKPENDLERALVMEQQFRQEVMTLANLKHPNIVRFIGACRKLMVWCIVTEYAKGGSVRQFLMKRQNRSVPLKLAVKQAIDVAKGMEYIHGLGFIHRDLKSDNLLIFSDKSIKIADFGVARIEVKSEGMTPETGTYRWMAPSVDKSFVLPYQSIKSDITPIKIVKVFLTSKYIGRGWILFCLQRVLTDGREVAVKQLKIESRQGDREFKSEVEIISHVHHRHLVSLVGYCISYDQRLLVYDFVPNGTLESHLHGKNTRPVMDWATRVKPSIHFDQYI